MGNEEEQVKAICGAIPSNSIVVTDEKKYLHEIETTARLKNSSVIISDDSVNLSDINLPFGVIESNVKIAFAVFKSASIEGKTIAKAIEEKINNSEKLLYEFNINGKNIRFLNGFSVNDVSSAKDFLNYWESKLHESKELNIIFNSRSDRPLRSLAFTAWISTINKLNKVILMGNHTPRVKLELIRNGISARKIYFWDKSKIKLSLMYLNEIAGPNSIFVGLGNIAGGGQLIINLMRQNAFVKI